MMEDRITSSIGNDKLYKMGFTGCCIGTLRKLTQKQVKELVEELDKIRNNETSTPRLDKNLQ